MWRLQHIDDLTFLVRGLGVTAINLDLTGVTFIDLHGCRALHAFRQDLEARGVEIVEERWSTVVARIHDLIARP